jgi:hypothetical protein
MAAKLGYKTTGSSRARCDGRFEVQMRPWIFNCALTPTDWHLEESGHMQEVAHALNYQIVNVINGGTDRKTAEQKMAQFVATLDISPGSKHLVLSVVDRLLRATFE